MLRHFPYAPQQFLKLGGLQVLRSLVQEKGMEVLAVRVVTLLYDLVTEKVSTQGPATPALCVWHQCGLGTSSSYGPSCQLPVGCKCRLLPPIPPVLRRGLWRRLTPSLQAHTSAFGTPDLLFHCLSGVMVTGRKSYMEAARTSL